MAFKSESKQIGKHRYTVTQLDAVRGSKAALRLAKVVGPALSAYSGEDAESKAISALLSNLEEKDFDYLRETLSSATTVAGGKYGEREPALDDVFAVHFAGNYGEMIGWLAFAVKVNFASFFSGVGELLSALGSASPSTTTQGSTGSSGA